MPTFEFEDGAAQSTFVSVTGPGTATGSISFFNDTVGFTFSAALAGSGSAILAHDPNNLSGLLGASLFSSATTSVWALDLQAPSAHFSGSVLLNFTAVGGNVRVTFDATGTGANIVTSASGPTVVGAAGTFSVIRFSFSSGTGSFSLNDITTNITCFVAGTRIATLDGDKLVEELAEGDVICTPEGSTTVRWVGTREVDPRLVRPEMVNPVSITAGALGNDRDLLVSPDHGILVDGCLVNASALVNGATIRRVARPEPFTYYHVETDAHELILAEGVPCETYLPEREEFSFDNEATRPAREIAEMDLPRITSARLVPQPSRAA